MKKTRFALAIVSAMLAAVQLPAQEGSLGISISPRYEAGFVGVLSHVYRVGSKTDGNIDFDFVRSGGQELLFPYQRFTVEAAIGDSNRVSFVYQPLTFVTKAVSGQNGNPPIVIDGRTFASGTPVDIKYGFDFWRVSWLYDFAAAPETILGAGLSLQLRNASIYFESADGEILSLTQDLGPVPILKVLAAHRFETGLGLRFEADGFYASSAFFNGVDYPFEGWVWDVHAAVEAPFIVGRAFLGLRAIGGGATGTSGAPRIYATESVSPETYNALSTLAVTLGLSL
jgi:hypothetical protein